MRCWCGTEWLQQIQAGWNWHDTSFREKETLKLSQSSTVLWCTKPITVAKGLNYSREHCSTFRHHVGWVGRTREWVRACNCMVVLRRPYIYILSFSLFLTFAYKHYPVGWRSLLHSTAEGVSSGWLVLMSLRWGTTIIRREIKLGSSKLI